jgi:hypothetical protein
VYSSPTRMRVERETARRGNAPVVITTLLSLLVVGAAVAAVAYLVLRTPSSVDSSERLEPIGTALPAPSEQPSLPTVVPTSEPDPEPEPVLGFTGDGPAVTELPTVTAPEPEPEQKAVAQDAGPPPTPRLIALPTAVPPTVPAPAPTLPPPVPVDAVPIVALEPVESAAPPPTAAPSTAPTAVPTPAPIDDPFDIFEDESPPIVASGSDAAERVRDIQDQVRNPDSDRDNADNGNDNLTVPVVVPTIAVARGGGNGSVEIIMPDVDAMIEEITARATDPNRNPNVSNIARPDNDQDRDDNRVITERDEDDERSTEGRRKSARERINERNTRKTPTANSRDIIVPNIDTGNSRGRDNGNCRDPFENLPEDMRPENFPFDNC